MRSVVSRRSYGFTLIELLIVLAMIAVLAAIAVPSLLRGRFTANEQAAVSGLKTLVAVESAWQRSDFDGNEIRDYWVDDLRSLHFCTDKSGRYVKLIDISFAQADISWDGKPKSGYLYMAMPRDELSTDIQLSKRTRFGFTTYPAEYDRTGIRSFTVNQEGVVYALDRGLETPDPISSFPGVDPSQTGWSPVGGD